MSELPATAVYGLRYPHLDDQAGHAPVQVQRLAEDTETALSELNPDTGVRSDLAVTLGPGWSLLQKQHRIISSTMCLFLWLERTDSAFPTATSEGNILGDPTFATITEAAMRPAFTVYGRFVASLTSGEYQIDAGTGQIQFVSMHGGSTIASAANARVHTIYPLP